MAIIKNWWRKSCIWIYDKTKWLWLVSVAGITITETITQYPEQDLYGLRPSDNQLFWGTIFFVTAYAINSFFRDRGKSYIWADNKANYHRRISGLKEELAGELEASLTAQLRELSNDLSFSMQERISVYVLSNDKESFRCAARFSMHPQHRDHSVRKDEYPKENGIIGYVYNEGCNHGFLRDKDIPCAKSSLDERIAYLAKKYQMDEKTVHNLRMNSRDIIGICLLDKNQEFAAVIIFESERQNFLDEEKLKLFYNNESEFSNKRDEIIRVLERLKSKTSPSDAQINAEEELRNG